MSTPPKIKVVQYMYGHSNHFSLSERINRAYCQRHGYDYVVHHDTPEPGRYPSWQKIPVMQEELHDCDYLLYLDADAFFYSREMRIEWELLPLLDTKSILMAQNLMSETVRRFPKRPNSGVILLKNDDVSRRFLTSWNLSSAKDPVGCWIPPYEHFNLWRLTFSIFKQSMVVLDDYYQMNGHFGLFIRHLQGLSDGERTGQMVRFINDTLQEYDRPQPISSKIRVLQYMHGVFEYFQRSSLVNSTYCQRYGYEYRIDCSPPRDDRHVVWQKTDAMLEGLEGCDYLLFLDADAIFYGSEWSVEEHLLPLMDGHDILMAQDFTSERSRWTPGYPNAGVILMKSNRKTRSLLEMWRNCPDLDPSLRNLWPPMQLALWRYVMPAFPATIKVLDEYYLMNGAWGQYIRHYMIHSDETRTEAIRDYCRNRQLEIR